MPQCWDLQPTLSDSYFGQRFLRINLKTPLQRHCPINYFISQLFSAKCEPSPFSRTLNVTCRYCRATWKSRTLENVIILTIKKCQFAGFAWQQPSSSSSRNCPVAPLCISAISPTLESEIGASQRLMVWRFVMFLSSVLPIILTASLLQWQERQIQSRSKQ